MTLHGSWLSTKSRQVGQVNGIHPKHLLTTDMTAGDNGSIEMSWEVSPIGGRLYATHLVQQD